MTNRELSFCIIIPVFNHYQAIAQVVKILKDFEYHCILVNDGSDTECTNVLQQIAEQERDWIQLIERDENGGKGAAVINGLNIAIEQGFSHAIQVDADGQHNLNDIKGFVDNSSKYPDHVIFGQPCFDESIPKKRLYGRYITNLWVWINTVSLAIADGMCGFRCYPLVAVEKLLQTTELGQRMDFDIDIAVRLYWQGVNVINIPTQVKYPIDGISHFKLWQDNVLISKKHAQHFFGMLWRFPQLLLRHLK